MRTNDLGSQDEETSHSLVSADLHQWGENSGPLLGGTVGLAGKVDSACSNRTYGR